MNQDKKPRQEEWYILIATVLVLASVMWAVDNIIYIIILNKFDFSNRLPDVVLTILHWDQVRGVVPALLVSFLAGLIFLIRPVLSSLGGIIFILWGCARNLQTTTWMAASVGKGFSSP